MDKTGAHYPLPEFRIRIAIISFIFFFGINCCMFYFRFLNSLRTDLILFSDTEINKTNFTHNNICHLLNILQDS